MSAHILYKEWSHLTKHSESGLQEEHTQGRNSPGSVSKPSTSGPDPSWNHRRVETLLVRCSPSCPSALSLHWLEMSTYRQMEAHVRCPYDETHSILPERLWKHIRKCSLQNPHIASKMKTCPYLSTHIVKDEDFEQHVKECPRREVIHRWLPLSKISD